MSKLEYSSVLCEHCPFTDYGYVPVNTGPHNLCEGAQCEEAYENWKESDPENNTAAIDDLF